MLWFVMNIQKESCHNQDLSFIFAMELFLFIHFMYISKRVSHNINLSNSVLFIHIRV